MTKRLSILFLLLAAWPLAAQEAPPRLSLEEAIRIARENNPAFRGAQTELSVADARERESLGAFLPRLSAGMALDGSSSRSWTGTDPFGNPLPAEQAVETLRSSGSHGLSLSVPVFQRGRLGQLHAARAEGGAATAQVRMEEEKLRAEVTRRYHDALRLERLIELEEKLLVSARDRLDATQRLFGIGAQGMSEVLGAEVEVARQEQAVEQARGEARKAKLALGETLGVMDAADAVLSSAPLAVFDPAGLSADSLVALALVGSPRVEQASSSLSAAEHRVSAARGQRWPTVSARAGFSRSTSGLDDQGLSILDPSTLANRNLSFGLSVDLPLFDQFRSSLSVAQAEAGRTRARESVRRERLAVEREVRSALIDLQNAHRSIQLAERAAELSQDRLEMAREQYRLGALKFIDLQTVVDRTAQAERDALRARFEFAGALASLEEKVGTPVRREGR